jgi:predicted molibdopterin-dependent oxidoreductase YjgC
MNVQITIDGERLEVPAGITLAGALLLLRKQIFRTTPLQGKPRSQFCGMGLCYDCVVELNGQANVRACQVWVEDDMQVCTQHGEPGLIDFTQSENKS